MQRDAWGRAGMFGAVVLGAALYWQWLNVAPTVRIPAPVLPSPNAHDALYDAARRERDDDKVSVAHVANPPKDQHVYSLAEKEALVAENALALDALRDALKLPYWYPPARSAKTLFPELPKYRAMARLLLLESQVREAQGDPAGAVASCLDAVEMGIKIPHGGVLITALVGDACEAIGYRPLWGLIDHLDGGAAAVAARRLETLNSDRFGFSSTMQEAKWSGQACLMEAFDGKSTFAAYSDLYRTDDPDSASGDSSGPTAKEAIAAYRSLLTHGKRRILADYTASLDARIAQAKQPYSIAWAPIPAGTDPFNQILLPVFEGASRKDTQTRMQSGLLTCALALRAYSCRHGGSYPDSLAALASDGILTRIPTDPYAARADAPFGYRRDGEDKYTLYSVGTDGIDDGGAPVDPAKINPVMRYWPEPGDKGDWVVGINIGGPAPAPTAK